MTDLISREAAIAAHLAECEMFNDIVHRLRSNGWSKIDAEGQALDIIERMREVEQP